MSLQDLTYLRTRGKVPTMVWVVVGDRPRMQMDGPDMVVIRPVDDVKRMDFRPLIGLHVDLFECGNHPELFDETAKSIDAARPKSTGYARNAKSVSGVNDAHEAVLKRAWEFLCGTD